MDSKELELLIYLITSAQGFRESEDLWIHPSYRGGVQAVSDHPGKRSAE